MDSPTRPTSRSVLVLIAGVALAGVLLVLYTWRLPPFRSDFESTENGYVRGDVTVIAPKVDGYVAEVLVRDFATVNTGDVLVQLDDGNYRQKVAQGRASVAAQEANLANVVQARRAREAGIASAKAAVETARAQLINAEAQLERTRADRRRTQALVGDGSVSERDSDQAEGLLRQAQAARTQSAAAVEQANAALAVAQQDLETVIVNRRAVEAAVEGARAALQLAEIDLNHTRIRAPRAGRLGQIGVRVGQYVTPGTQLMALVPPEVWVIANFKEGQTARMAPGQVASLEFDALDGARLVGHIQHVSPAMGSEFSVIPADNATGNFTKIPQRLPIRITVDPNEPLLPRLRPGMSVFVRVDTSSRAAP